MRNLIFQYYIPYEAGDADMGGFQLPDWAQGGSYSARRYAEICGAEYEFSNERYFRHLDPRLDSLRIFYDEKYDEYDNILCLDLDMLIKTKENIFEKDIGDVAMVHELGVHVSQGNWLRNVMEVPLEKRGIIAYGKHLFGSDWMFPKSELYPDEAWRYLNGGLQLWSKEGRQKARKHFTSVDNYYLHTRYTEQMYINLQLSQPIFNVKELPTEWNRIAIYQKPLFDGKVNHFLARHKFSIPQLIKDGWSV